MTYTITVIDMTPPLLVSRELAEELGYTIAAGPRPPTPIERALAILAPHLDGVALYQPTA
ncbi:hypothetical protein ABT010_13300 [Streptomyces sp. NPDC002668]|uniref:hypothetical protein n=1 Tax=Streptomyces sp. NPDC002668 TaxID=3154422 RepID=UPI00331DC5DE